MTTTVKRIDNLDAAMIERVQPHLDFSRRAPGEHAP
jgi:hypothetical protein